MGYDQEGSYAETKGFRVNCFVVGFELEGFRLFLRVSKRLNLMVFMHVDCNIKSESAHGIVCLDIIKVDITIPPFSLLIHSNARLCYFIPFKYVTLNNTLLIGGIGFCKFIC